MAAQWFGEATLNRSRI